MALLSERKFSFASKAVPEDTFVVVNFKGFEALSKPYEFNIMLVSEHADLDLTDVLQKPAKFTIYREDGENVDYHGILCQFEQLHEFEGYVFYRAILVPRLWWLKLTHHNQVLLKKTAPEVIELVLKDGGLFSMDFELRIQNAYNEVDYVCQYGESHFNFISRWMEREGMYYYFEQTPTGEKLIITDTKISHMVLPQGGILFYNPPTGLDLAHRYEIIQSLSCRQSLLPQKVLLKDYNYEKPSLSISGSADVDPRGRGEDYIYGEHFLTSEEGNRLAKIRAEELLCRKAVFYGESTVPFMEPGFTFDLQNHYRHDYNRKYLIAEVTHEGSQTRYLISGIGRGLSETEQKLFYSNTFTAIPAGAQFRPERTAVKSSISGSLHAKIDAEGSGQYAELDEHGRYKVRLPFDINDEHREGKASSFIRMVQPYAGSDHGMHFPLHKGTEVLLTFIDGDPDRPIIAGAIPNPESSSPITSANQTMAGIRTGGQNKISIEDQDGNQRIVMQTPSENSWLRIGTPNDPPGLTLDGDAGTATQGGADGIRMNTSGELTETIGSNKAVTVGGNKTEVVSGNKSVTVHGNDSETIDGTKTVAVTGNVTETFSANKTETVGTSGGSVSKSETVHGNKTSTINGDETETITGNKDETISGNYNLTATGDLTINSNSVTELVNESNTYWNSGAENSAFGGSQTEIFLGNSASINVGPEESLALAVSFAFSFGFNLEFFLGLKVDIATGWKAEFDLAGDLRKSPANITAEDIKIEGGMLKIGTKSIKIDNNAFTMQ